MRILVTDGMDKSAIAKLKELGHEVVEQFYEADVLGEAMRARNSSPRVPAETSCS